MAAGISGSSDVAVTVTASPTFNSKEPSVMSNAVVCVSMVKSKSSTVAENALPGKSVADAAPTEIVPAEAPDELMTKFSTPTVGFTISNSVPMVKVWLAVALALLMTKASAEISRSANAVTLINSLPPEATTRVASSMMREMTLSSPVPSLVKENPPLRLTTILPTEISRFTSSPMSCR